jgi:hypothetical protein
MLIETTDATYKIKKMAGSYLVERVGCSPKGTDADLPEKVSFEGDLIVFNSLGELVLFRNDTRVLITKPIVFSEAITAPQVQLGR